MDPITLASCSAVFLIVLFLLRVPIAVALLLTGFIGLTVMTGWIGNQYSLSLGIKRALGFLGSDPYSFVTSFTLIAVPMFLLMGNFAFYAKATTEGFETARIWFARVPGALALATIAGCALFAAMSGSSLANAAAMGKIAVPEMLRARYDKGLASAVVAAGGTLGALIPPSILIVIYGIFTEQSIGRLLIAGLPAGLLTAGLYMAMIYVRAKINPDLAPQLETRYTWGEKVKSLSGTGQFILLFFIVMGSIYTGLATPTEASAVGAAGMLAIGLSRRKLDRQLIRSSIVDTLRQSSSIFAIAIGAKVFVAFIAYTQVSTVFADWVGDLGLPPLLLMVVLSVLYVVLGMFMDPLGIMLLTLPVVVPVITAAGYDLIWFGVIMVKYLEIGMITPPVGLNVFVLKASIGNAVSLEKIFRGIGWFLLMDVVTLSILIYFPGIIMWLPNMVFATY
jgi:C4-dicarboxylate transporter DctM subunit